MGECVSAYLIRLLLCYCLLRTVYCIYSSLLRYRLTPQSRMVATVRYKLLDLSARLIYLVLDYTVASGFDSLKQCLLTLLPQLLLSLKLLPQLHSCRSSIVRVKRYSYRFVRQSLQLIQQRAPLLFAAAFCAILFLHTTHLLR